ncbi:MAG: ATP-binding protein [Burkholderiales bacterium]
MQNRKDRTERRIDDRRRDAVLSAEQAANALKDEFLAVLSHELKNPLNLIQMKAELLMRLPEVRNMPAVQRAADTIRRTVLSQARIIDDLLDLSRAHTGKFSLTCAPVPLRPLMERILEAVHGDADARSLRLAFEMPAEALTAYGDFVRIEQILWNLLSNALKFTPPGGRVTVRLRREEDCARIEVEDTGLGIEPALLPEVFDMFRQADTRIAREKGGLGIGLALVKSLAELHGGRAAVHSDGLGRGARFSVWLPLSMAITPPAPAVPQQANPLAGLRLLVVDDTADTLETFGMLLELEGAQVTRAGSAEQALAAAAEGAFDLLLSDVAMPGMDGYQLIGALRRQPRHARLPAVAVTGFGRPQDHQRALAAGFDGHIGKPVSIEALRDLVATLRRRPSSAG